MSDRRATQLLAEVGLVNAGCVDGDMTPTVNRHIDDGQGARIDFILFSPALAAAMVPGSYRVWINELGSRFSNHRMVSVRLDLSRLDGWVSPRAAVTARTIPAPTTAIPSSQEGRTR